MLISFFEEFPNKVSLSKLRLINFNTKIYLAASSYKEFNKIASKIKNKFVKEIIYWPILDEKEGYWISPFSKRDALIRVFSENINGSVMIDAELPKNKSLYLTELHNFLKNKSSIKNFIKKNKVYTAEYYPEGFLKNIILSFFGLSFDPNKFNNNVIKMLYHSMHNFNENFLKNKIRYGVNKYKDKYLLAFGTIAHGIKGNEPLLSLAKLDKDLKIAKELKVKEVIIYRLGGLDKNYLKVIKKYV